MTGYQLTDKNRGDFTILAIEDLIDSSLSEIFARINTFTGSDSDLESLETKLFEDHYNSTEAISGISPCLGTCLNNQLKHYLELDYLTQDEAIFLLLGLDINHMPKGFSMSHMRTPHSVTEILDIAVINTREYKLLIRAISAGKESTDRGIQTDSKGNIYTDSFVAWAINNGLLVDKPIINISDIKTNNIDDTYNPKRKAVVEHNTKVSVQDYLEWEDPRPNNNKNPHSFANNLDAYNTLLPKLKPLLRTDENGEDEYPEPSTIARYIRNYQKKDSI